MAATLQHQAAREFARALKCAKKSAAKGKPELAVDWCRYGASIAWSSNPGFVYSHEMELLLAEIGRKYLSPVSAPAFSDGPLHRFLHVMTAAYERGGHTRAVSRWIETCAQHAPLEQHSILISKQGEAPLPPWLAHSAQRTGGDCIELSPLLTWLETAQAIRAKSCDYDVIVLHTHPNDPVPNLAFHDQPVLVLFFNHADHSFVLGMDVSTVVADLRLAGQDLTFSHRAQAPLKCLIPVPLIDNVPSSRNKAEARRRLRLPFDAPIALTIGERYKYQPALGYSFPDVLSSFCHADPRVIVVAIGISELDCPPELDRLTKEQFRPVGYIIDPEALDLYYAASDIYLDCFPCGSGTALLDAARHALPVQRMNNVRCPILQSDDLALDSVLTRASNQSEYVAGALEWLDWPETRRAELGSHLRAAVLKEHCGASWKSKWLDPALNALNSPDLTAIAPKINVEDREPGHCQSLLALRNNAHPASMFIATTILEIPEIDRKIRISGVWRSVKPLLFDSAQAGTSRERFSIFRNLLKTVLPRPFVIIAARLLHPILKML